MQYVNESAVVEVNVPAVVSAKLHVKSTKLASTKTHADATLPTAVSGHSDRGAGETRGFQLQPFRLQSQSQSNRSKRTFIKKDSASHTVFGWSMGVVRCWRLSRRQTWGEIGNECQEPWMLNDCLDSDL